MMKNKKLAAALALVVLLTVSSNTLEASACGTAGGPYGFVESYYDYYGGTPSTCPKYKLIGGVGSGSSGTRTYWCGSSVTSNSNYMSAVSNAASGWDNGSSLISMTYTPTLNINTVAFSVYCESYGTQGNPGATYWYSGSTQVNNGATFGNFTRSEVFLYSTYFGSATPNQRQATTAHEFGHGMALNHPFNESFYPNYLMTSSTFRASNRITPASADISVITHLYT